MSQRQVAEPAINHEAADLGELRMKIEKRNGFLKGKTKHFADGFTLPSDVCDVRAVTISMAVVAREKSIRHESHFEFDAALARTRD